MLQQSADYLTIANDSCTADDEQDKNYQNCAVYFVL